MVVLAALRARIKGWMPSGSTARPLGHARQRRGAGVGLAAIINIIWPRTPDAPWLDNNIVLVMLLSVLAIGTVYMLITGRADRSDAPYGDAIPTAQSTNSAR